MKLLDKLAAKLPLSDWATEPFGPDWRIIFVSAIYGIGAGISIFIVLVLLFG